MSQLIQVHCLTEEQVTITLNNLCKLRELDKPKILSRNKPKYSKELCERENLLFITKFADKYITYIATRNNKEDKTTNHGFIVIFADKVDTYNISACAALYIEHLREKIDPKAYPPHIDILCAFNVNENLRTHYKSDILPKCNYRVWSLCEIYPMIGSKTDLFRLTFDYKKLPYEPTYNNKEYLKIRDSDPIVKTLNAIPNELIVCKYLSYDDSVFASTIIKQVEHVVSNIHTIDASGCVKYYQ